MNILIGILIGLGALLALFFLYLVVIIFFSGFSVPPQPLSTRTEDGKQTAPSCRQDVSFLSGGEKISAWLYLPEVQVVPLPCVIMSNGFGGTTGMILESYALRFVEAGVAVLTYDYRHFGESEGEPRQLFFISKQLEDLRAAIAFARQRKEVAEEKIVLWGTSASGGYGLILAAEDPKIAAIIGQCPALDSHADGHLALEREGMKSLLRLIMHAQRDMGRSRFNLSPHRIPIVGKPGTVAMFTAPGVMEGYSALAPSNFVNEICPRGLLRTHGYNPINFADKVACPVLLQVCQHDNLVSKASYQKTTKILGELVELIEYPIGHFDIYQGQHFERAVEAQIEFLYKYLVRGVD